MGKDNANTRMYDSPDGENCLEKTYHTTRLATYVGGVVSIYEMIGWSKPSNVPEIAGRLLHFTLPAAAAGAVFATTTCMAGDFRGRDGPINHAIGGCAAGLILGAKAKSYKVGSSLCIGFAGFASLYKAMKDEGLGMIPETPWYMKERGHFKQYERVQIGTRPPVTEPQNY